MSDQLFKKIDDILLILDNEIDNQKKIRDEADDFEDWEKGQEISLKSYKNIRSLKNWRADLFALCSEIKNSQIFNAEEQENDSKVPVSNEAVGEDVHSFAPPSKSDNDFSVSDIAEPFQKEIESDSSVADWVSSAYQIYNEISDIPKNEHSEPQSDNTDIGIKAVSSHNASVSITRDNEQSAMTAPIQNEPFQFVMFDKSYFAESISDFVTKFCEIMIIHYPYKMALADMALTKYFTDSFSKNFHNLIRLSNGLYVDVYDSMGLVMKMVNDVLTYCQVSENTLKPEVKQ